MNKVEIWKKVVEKIREDVKEGRELEYREGEIGITALLSCPLKVELRKQHPDIEAVAVEIDDGFLWEQQAKSALRSVVEGIGGVFEEEKDLVDEVEGLRIRGHLDCFAEFSDEVWGIELKSPKAVLLKKLPEEDLLLKGVFLIDEKGEYVINNPLYYKQAQVQKHILKKLYPEKQVRQFLFYKAPVRRGRFEKKLYILVPVNEDITEEEYRELVRKFKEDRSPRYPNECTSYCEFYRCGLCEGKEFEAEDMEASYLDKETKDLLREYREMQAQLKTLENLLKKKLKGSVKFGGREIGWVLKKTIKLDEEKVAFTLPPERIPEFFQIKWNKKEDLIRELGEDVIEEIKEERVWRL